MKKIKFNLPLVNTHSHAAMVAFRGLAEDLPLDTWLKQYIWPREKERLNPQFIYQNTQAAIKEMRTNGVALFNDMYFFAEEIARAAEKMKMPAVIAEGILDFPTSSAKTPDEAIETTERLLLKYKNHPLIKIAVAPHSIYTVAAENLTRAKELADRHKAIYHIHCSETKKEFDDCLAQNKLTPVAYLDKLGVLDERTLLAHCVWLTDEDIKILAKRQVKVAHCPLSNLKLGSGVAPIAKMLAQGVVVALGTDGAASSNRLDIWEAGKFAALLQKGINLDPTQISAKQAVAMMTINGLKALGYENFHGQPLSFWQERLDQGGSYNYLYQAQASDLSFRF